MAKKWVVRVIAILMALIMALSVLYIVVSSFTATAVTQSQIDKLKKQQKEIEKKKQEIQSKINSLEYEQKTAIAKKEVLDEQIQLTQDDITNITDQIETYTLLIETKKGEVIEAQHNEELQWSRFKANIRTMEENGSVSYISVIFNANSFADLLSRFDFVESIMEHDEKLYQELKAAKQATIDAEAELEAAKAGQEADKADLLVKQGDLKTQLAAADALVEKIEGNIETEKDLYSQEVAAANNIQSDINRKMEELKKQQQLVVGTGKLIWPTPSCSIVTSPYGQRYHPIYHELRMHSGIDIGAKYGAGIVAADSGVVIISAYSSSYGNYIVVSHGDGVTTLYAHMSSRLKKTNDKVKQGEVIGKVGSTGASTGPHLHFEVSVNGSRVNPLNYFSSGSYIKQGWK